MKRIVLNGATSMLGIALINECIKNNIQVVAVCKKNSSNKGRLPSSSLLTIVECDLSELNQLSHTLDNGYDVFYHFGWTGTDKIQRIDPLIQMKNIDYTLQTIKFAKDIGCKTFIGAGSQAEYGICNLPLISPNTHTNPNTAYGIAKYSAGKLGAIYAKQLGINYIWTRIFSVYGIFDNENTLISTVLKKLILNENMDLTKGEQMWDYLYSEDAGKAFYLIGEKGKNNAMYCIGSGIAKPLYEYIHIIQSHFKGNNKIVLGGIPYPENQVMNLCADISNLTLDTGFVPTITFEEGIKQTIQWIKNHKQ